MIARRILVVVTCLSLAWLVLGIRTAVAADKSGPLGRAFEKLKDKNKLTLGYFGGANTACVGASDPSKNSWRALTTSWFKGQFPQAKITEANPPLADGGSEFGAFRCQSELMSKDPDLVFIEFAVDDARGSETRIKRSIEGIVRQIWLTNPWAEIVFVYTTTKELSAAYAKGQVPKAIEYHRAVARHYGIPEIEIGRALVEQIARGEGTWETLTTDGKQLNDSGHASAMKTVQTFLESHRQDALAQPMITLVDPLSNDPFSGAHIEEVANLPAEGWTKTEQPAVEKRRSQNYLVASEPGTELVYPFSGSTIGLLWLAAPDGGDIEWSIDGSTPKRLSSRDNSAPQSSKDHSIILSDELSPGQHTLKIKVLGEKNSKSPAAWIRIAAILVHCDC